MSSIVRRMLSGVAGALCMCGLAEVHAAPVTVTHGSTSVTLDFTTIDSPGNAADTTGYGSVAHDYRIMTYELTTDQYNTVAAATTLPNAAAPWTGNQPAAGIKYSEAASFANWLTSGDVTQGAYTISAQSTVTIDRAGAIATYGYGNVFVIPTDDEWYKAAFYDSANDVYFDYGTGSDTTPTPTTGSTNADEAVYRILQVFPSEPLGPAEVNNAGGVSAYGTMAQSGNIAEYIEQIATDTKPRHRGGHYSDGADTNLSSTGLRGSNSSDFSTPSTVGLRMVLLTAEPGGVLIPEPGAASLLAVGATLLLARRGDTHR